MKKYLILIAVILLIGASKIYAQCPSDSLPGPVPGMGPWINDGCVTVYVPKWDNPSVLCPWNVCYCWRTGGATAPFTEIYIYGHSRIDPACDPFNENSNIRSILFKKLYKLNPKGNDWPCPPCSLGVGTPNTRLTVSGCYSTTPPFESCESCCFYCVADFAICCDEYGNQIETLISQSTVGTNVCPANCAIGPCNAP